MNRFELLSTFYQIRGNIDFKIFLPFGVLSNGILSPEHVLSAVIRFSSYYISSWQVSVFWVGGMSIRRMATDGLINPYIRIK